MRHGLLTSKSFFGIFLTSAAYPRMGAEKSYGKESCLEDVCAPFVFGNDPYHGLRDAVVLELEAHRGIS